MTNGDRAMKLRFFWNGIKVGTGKIQRCSYSLGALLRHPAGTITIYGKEYWPGFSAEVRAAFTVENDSDLQTDYFEKDRIRVTPDHPLYSEIRAAWEAHEAHYAKRFPAAVQS